MIFRRTLRTAHGVNMALHALSVMFAYGFFTAVMSSGAALWAAALVAVFPLSADAVGYISGRSNVLAWTFGYLGLFLAASDVPAGALVSFVAAVLSKEEAVTQFAIAAMLGWYFGWPLWWIYGVAPLALLWIGRKRILEMIRSQNFGMVAMGFPKPLAWPRYPLASFADHALLLPWWWCGVSLCAQPKWGALDVRRVVAAAGVTLFGFWIAPPSAAWIALMALPFIVVPVADRILASRYYGLAGAVGFTAGPVLAETWWPLALTLVAALMASCCLRAKAYRSDRAYWTQVIADGGRSDFALINLSNAALNEGKHPEAEAWLAKAVAAHPNAALAYFNLAFIMSFRDLPKAIEMAASVMDRFPELAHGWDRLGAWQFKAGRLNEARRSWKRCLDLRPMAAAYNGMGLREVNRKCWGLAETAFRLASESNPAHVAYRWNQAHMLGILGDQEGKIRLLKQCPRQVIVSDDMVLVKESRT